MVIQKLIGKIMGDQNAKNIKAIEPLVEQVNHHYKLYQAASLDEAAIQDKTQLFRDRIQNGETLDEILPEAFGLVKYACEYINGRSWDVRGESFTWGKMVPYDVQIIGGIVLHQGKIAEMKTGEGKTLVSTMPAYLNALSGKSVYVVTVNEYLAQRDAEWMSGLYQCLGLTVGKVIAHQPNDEKRTAYQADIIYGTNNEFGFDYLRDNMATRKEQLVQADLSYAIVDEVDSILVDEARTPLIISAPAEESNDKYFRYAQLIPQLKENEHYNIDEKQRTATLTEEGIAKMESLLGLENIYTEAGYEEVHHIEQALKASAVYKRDKDYVIQEGEIVIVDDFTGRLMPGRRYSHGLHQAIEAKENVEVKRESKTLASITFQNFFRLFDKLAGMTGTAKTEEEEFYKIYGLATVVIPTNRPIARNDLSDNIYADTRTKFKAVVSKVKELHEAGRPILIGTVSVEQSEALSSIFSKTGIPHNVLNAKNHEREAEIVADAGKKGAVTIATNMAGRGTDIKITDEVKDLGGLFILGTERHESRRIDNQLRGRAGRQGDPGDSQFYVSMEDQIMRVFGGDRVKTIMQALKLPEDTPVTNKYITKALESAQKRVEGYNFDMRKHVVEYDDVINYHREIIYKLRRQILMGEDVENEVLKLFEQEAEVIILSHKDANGSYDFKEIAETVSAVHRSPVAPIPQAKYEELNTDEALIDLVKNYFWREYKGREASLPDPQIMREVERQVYLRAIDSVWVEHLESMNQLRKSVALEGYGQRDPLIIYKDLAYNEFQQSLGRIRDNFVNTIFKVNITPQVQKVVTGDVYETTSQKTNAAEIESTLTKSPNSDNNVRVIDKSGQTEDNGSAYADSGRNDPCPCGSGKKFKHCHGK